VLGRRFEGLLQRVVEAVEVLLGQRAPHKVGHRGVHRVEPFRRLVFAVPKRDERERVRELPRAVEYGGRVP